MKMITPIAITEAMLLSSTVAEPDSALGETAWSATTIYAAGDERYVGAPTSTVTITQASPAVVSWAANGLAVDSPVVLSTTGTRPSGFTAGRTYFVRQRLTDGTFTLSATKGGRAISTTTAGSGTHTATAKIHTIYQALIGQRSTVTFDAGTDKVNYTAHDLAADTAVVFTNSGGGLPPELTAGTTYYVRSPGVNDFQVSATSGGSAINLSTAGTGTHTAGLAATYNQPPAISSSVWESVGSTNKWAMFDQRGGTQTTADDEIVVVMTPGRFNALHVIGVDADSVSVSLEVPGSPTSTVYTYSMDLSNGTEVGDWFQYFYNPIYQADAVTVLDLVDASLLDLPAYGEGVLTVTITRTGGQVSCGALIVGMYEDLGDTVGEPSFEIIDYSTKETDARGNTTIEEGPYRKRMTAQVLVASSNYDNVNRLMTAKRAAPVVWSGADDTYTSLIVYGFLVGWSTSPKNGYALLEMQVESL